MPTGEELVSMLARTLDQTGGIVANVKPDQTGLPTPCASFDVRELLNHIVYDAKMFAETAQGLPRPQAGGDLIGDDWAAAYDEAAATLLAVWEQPGATEGTIAIPQGELPRTWRLGQQIANFAVHGWDVAKATGQPTELDQEVGQFALDWGRDNIKPEYRGEEGSGKTFGLEVAVPDEAMLYDRLAGFFGRDPSAEL